jgi:hypothetical protein
MFTKSPEIIVALLPVAIGSIIMDLRAMREYAILKLDDGELLVPAKPRIQRIVAYSLMADFLMLAVLAQFLGGYDSVVLANSTVVYGLYLMETSGAKGAIEAFRPEIEKFEEVEVEKEKVGR